MTTIGVCLNAMRPTAGVKTNSEVWFRQFKELLAASSGSETGKEAAEKLLETIKDE